MNMHASCGQSLIGSTEHQLNVAAMYLPLHKWLSLSGKHRPPSMLSVVTIVVAVVVIDVRWRRAATKDYENYATNLQSSNAFP